MNNTCDHGDGFPPSVEAMRRLPIGERLALAVDELVVLMDKRVAHRIIKNLTKKSDGGRDIERILGVPDDQLRKIKGMGKGSIADVNDALARIGIRRSSDGTLTAIDVR